AADLDVAQLESLITIAVQDGGVLARRAADERTELAAPLYDQTISLNDRAVQARHCLGISRVGAVNAAAFIADRNIYFPRGQLNDRRARTRACAGGVNTILQVFGHIVRAGPVQYVRDEGGRYVAQQVVWLV